jgi:copper chaperone CopZ
VILALLPRFATRDIVASFPCSYHQWVQGQIMAEFTLRIDGMHCGACVRRVSQALASEGLNVKEVRLGAARIEAARIETARMEVARIESGQDPDPVDRALAVIQKAGYSAHLDPTGETSPPHAG